MDKELRILILEDVPADAELEENELRKAGVLFTSKCVDTKEIFQKELLDFSPDLILSDYSLPSFDGIAALTIAQEKCPDVPFILVTGAMGEEFAIETLKKGATDYVLKSNLKRLVPVINRALEEAEARAERKQARAILRESEERYDALFKNTHDMIQSVTPDGHFNFVNQAWLKVMGYTLDELQKITIFDILHPSCMSHCREAFQKVMSGESLDNIEAIFVSKEGRHIDVEGNVSARFVGEKIVASQGIFRDITERKHAAEALQESEKMYRLLAENTTDMITLLQLDSTYLYISPACRTLFGYETEELLGTKAFGQIHPDDVQRVISISQEAVRTGGSTVLQYRHLKKDGQYVWVESMGKVIKNEVTGEIGDIICDVRDITERKRAEEEILKTKRDWEDIFHAIGHPTIILDADHNIISANRATLKALGAHSEEEIKGKKCYELFHNTKEPPQGCPLEKMLTSGNFETVEMEMKASGGVYLVSCTPVLDEKGNLQKVIHIATDITDRKRAEDAQKLEKAYFEQLFENAPEAIVVGDIEGRIVHVNADFNKLFAYT
ncbi:MAG: PAS domain S-box protein, partial [Thermodesulfovibrionales bacterium]